MGAKPILIRLLWPYAHLLVSGPVTYAGAREDLDFGNADNHTEYGLQVGLKTPTKQHPDSPPYTTETTTDNQNGWLICIIIILSIYIMAIHFKGHFMKGLVKIRIYLHKSFSSVGWSQLASEGESNTSLMLGYDDEYFRTHQYKKKHRNGGISTSDDELLKAFKEHILKPITYSYNEVVKENAQLKKKFSPQSSAPVQDTVLIDLDGLNFEQQTSLLIPKQGGIKHFQLYFNQTNLQISLKSEPNDGIDENVIECHQSENLSDIISEKMASTLTFDDINRADLKLCITFSFPLKDVIASTRCLDAWTEGFNYAGINKGQLLKKIRSATLNCGIRKIMADMDRSHDDYKKLSSVCAEEMKRTADHMHRYQRPLSIERDSMMIILLDLGIKDLKVSLISSDREATPQLHNNTSITMKIEEKMKNGSGEDLFKQIATLVGNFLSIHRLTDEKFHIVFTFRFPFTLVEDRPVLHHWTKGFHCSGVEGQDLEKLLWDALQAHQITKDTVERVILVHDTEVCLMSVATEDANCKIGFIIGYGMNACYTDKAQHGDGLHQNMVNTEWGGLCDKSDKLSFIQTETDKIVDENSPHPGKQIYEQMISALYLGEIMRLKIVQAAERQLLFLGKITEEIRQRGSFKAEYISEILNERDDEDNTADPLSYIRDVLQKVGYESDAVSDDDCHNVLYICSVVFQRAACLAAAGVATVIDHLAEPDVTVAVDGALYRNHVKFRRMLEKKLTELIGHKFKFRLRMPDHGSGRNEAVALAQLAHVVTRKSRDAHLTSAQSATRTRTHSRNASNNSITPRESHKAK